MKYFSLILVLTSLVFVSCNESNNSTEPEEDSTEQSETSEITCPECGHVEVEVLPTDECLLFYDCKKCGTKMTPEGDDCCVFCTHGTHKCPSMQEPSD